MGLAEENAEKIMSTIAVDEVKIGCDCRFFPGFYLLMNSGITTNQIPEGVCS